MILKLTVMNIADASGLKIVKIFHLYGGFWRKSTKIGNYCKGSVKSVKKRKKNNILKKVFRRGNIVKTYVVRQRYTIQRVDSSSIKFFDNANLMMKKKNVFQSKYLIGPGVMELSRKKYLSIFKSKV